MQKATSKKTDLKKFIRFLVILFVCLISLINSEPLGIDKQFNELKKEAFDIDFIISDEVFTDINSMTIEQIQEFLESKNSPLADKYLSQKYYLTYPVDTKIYNLIFPNGKLARESSPAEIIYYSARIQITPEINPNQVNPKILLVLLELNHGLIENSLKLDQYTLDNALKFYPIHGEFYKSNCEGFIDQLIGLASKLTRDFQSKEPGEQPPINIYGKWIVTKNRATYLIYKHNPSIVAKKNFYEIYLKYFGIMASSTLRTPEESVNWALNEEKHNPYGYYDSINDITYCFRFVRSAYNYPPRPGWGSAEDAANDLEPLNADDNPPYGAVTFYYWSIYGHAAIHIGNGIFLSPLLNQTDRGKIQRTSVYIGGCTYRGWKYFPGTPKVLYRVKDKQEVYWLQNNKLYWITEDAMHKMADKTPSEKDDTVLSRWEWNRICYYSSDFFNPDSYQQGPIFIKTDSSSDGLLIRQLGDIKVYVMEKGKRRWITTQEIFNSRGYDWNDVIDVTQSIMNYIPKADPITDGEALPTITSSLVIIQSSPYYVDDTITARYTIANKGTASITCDVLTVGGRDPDNEVADFDFRYNITLDPGDYYEYQGNLTLSKVGNYHLFCAYRKDGSWNTSVPTDPGISNTLDISVEAQINPVLEASTNPSGPWSTSVSGEQGTTFYFQGTGFTLSSTAIQHIKYPDGIDHTSNLSVDGNGNLSWDYTSSCDTPTGDYIIWVVDDSGESSNVVYENINRSSGCNHAPNSPTTPSGPDSGYIGTNYSYSTSATDPDEDALEYRFDWGDGNISEWGGPTQSHSWSSDDDYIIIAQAKDTSGATSSWSSGLTVTINLPPEIWNSPSTISFEATEGGSNPSSKILQIKNSGSETLSYSISDDVAWLSVSPANGTSTGDLNDHEASVDISGMSVGNYDATISITASEASNSPQVVSVSLAITASHTVAISDVPSGDSAGETGFSYAYTTGGSTCSQGHSVEYRFDWGDGTFSDWSSSTSASHSWSNASTYEVKAQARCSVETNVVSGWSSGTTVTISNVIIQYTLNIITTTGGTTDPKPGAYLYDAETNVIVKAIPEEAYSFSNWSGDESSADEEISMTMNSNKFVTANFIKTDAIEQIGYYDTPNYARGIDVLGNYVYVADGETGLLVIDVSDPNNPNLVGSIDTPGDAKSVFTSGSYAYVADYTSGLRIIDISSPSNPYEVGYYDTPSNSEGVYVSNSYAYVADGFSGLRIVDISNPTNPSEIGYFESTGAWGIVVSESYAYVADISSGLIILDVSDPFNPTEIGSFNISGGGAWGVSVVNSYAYICEQANGMGGLRIIDISNPSSPAQIGYLQMAGEVRNIEVLGSYAYLANGNQGLRIIDVSDPQNLFEVAFYDTSGFTFDVKVTNPFIYVADGLNGLEILEFSECLKPGVPGNPSPSDNATEQPQYLTLNWDELANATSYYVYFGETSSPDYHGEADTNSYNLSDLNSNTTYYWKVIVSNNCGTTEGPIWNFTTTGVTPSISGSVNNIDGSGLEGVTITFSDGGGSTTTDSSGNYTHIVDYGWSGTVTPAKAGYIFSPSSQSYTNISSDQFSQDYSAVILQYTLTINGETGGATQPSYGSYAYDFGAQITITVIPDIGYTFFHWTGDVPEGSENDNPLVQVMDSNKTLTANFTLNTYILNTQINPVEGGTVNKSPDKEHYNHGTSVELTANPNDGYTFSVWTGDVPEGQETDNPLTIVMDSDKNLTANFTLNTHALTTQAEPSSGGIITRNPDKEEYNHGENVELTVDINEGYRFTGWSGDVSSEYESDNPLTITMDSDKSITANFIQIYTLTIAADKGGITDPSPGGHTYDVGTEVSITAIVQSGYEFSGWSGDIPQGSEYDMPLVINMDSDKSITANFTVKEAGESDEEGLSLLGITLPDSCFIATASYGSLLHPHVEILRDFRDKYLMSNKIGRMLVNLYYKCSPYIAEFISKNKALKVIVRNQLVPFVAFSYMTVHFGLILTTIMFVLVLAISIFSVSFYRRRLI